MELSVIFFIAIGFFFSLGLYFQIIALSMARAGIIQPYHYTLIFWAIILGYIFYDDFPDIPTLIGAIGGVIVFFSVTYLDKKFKIDDPVGAISAHGVVGIWGIVAVCLSTDVALSAQIIGALTIFTWTFVVSGLVLYALDKAVGIRASESDEIAGLDQAEIGVESYADAE